ncbi:Intracellular distribution of mitochondria, partial [Dimargaris xerosporica]
MDPQSQPEQPGPASSPQEPQPAPELEQPTSEQALTLVVEAPDGQTLTLLASPNETVGDLKQNVIESPETCMHSCFHLTFNGQRLNEFVELGEVDGLVPDSKIIMVRDAYTDREVRSHVNRLRELLIGPYKPSVYAFGVDAGISVFSSVAGTLTEESAATLDAEVVPANGSPKDTETAGFLKPRKKGGKKKKSKSEASQTPSPPPFTAESGPGPMADSSAHPFANYVFDQVPSLAEYFPSTYHQDRTIPQCLGSLALSGWNPVPQFRKLQGDLIYLTVKTLEGATHEITGATSGFFVNQSSGSRFNPAPNTRVRSHRNHSLISLLESLSPAFATQFKKLQHFITSKPMLEVLPVAIPHAAYPWCVQTRVEAGNGTAQLHTFDPSRSSETYLQYGVDASDSLRDWNDELQSHRELPRATLQERVLRDRLINKVQADFAEAAAKGVQAIVEGSVVPLNPLEPASTHMYIYNNIFFSKGLDGRDTFKDQGGDAAAHVATSKDLEGVRILNGIDLESICTLGTVVVDYKGERLVAQSIVPGIFRRQDDSGALYGSVDNGVTIAADSKFHTKVAKIAEYLHWQEHTVVDAKGDSHTLYGSIETKGITGADGRSYLLDLFRFNPLDIEFIEAECDAASSQAKALPVYPHRLAMLRPEVMDLYWEHKSREAARAFLAKHKQEQADKAQSEKVPSEAGSESAVAEDTPVSTEAEDSNAAGSTDKPDVQPKIPKFELAFNPDVFSAVKVPDDEASQVQHRQQQTDARAVSQFLRTILIPGLVSDLLTYEVSVIDSASLTKLLHRRGINLRYLGRIAQLIDEAADQVRASTVQVVVHQAMVVRAVKHIVRKLLSPLTVQETPACLSHVLNCLLGNTYNPTPQPAEMASLSSEATEQPAYKALTPESLRAQIQTLIGSRFRYHLPAAALDLGSAQCVAYLRDVCLAVGIQIAARDYTFTSPSSSAAGTEEPGVLSTTFTPQDIVCLLPKLKDASARSMFAEQTFEAGRVSLAQGQKQLGLELLLESLALHEQTYGFLHTETGRCYASLAMIYHHLDEKEAAADFQRKAIIISERTSGLDDPDTIHNYLNLGLYEHGLGNTTMALRCLKHAITRWQLLSMVDHPDLATVDNNIGVMLQSLQDFATSCQFFERSTRIHETLLGRDHLLTANSQHVLAKAYALCGDFKKALHAEKLAYHAFQAKLGEDNPKTKESNGWLQELTASAVITAKMAMNPRHRMMNALHRQGGLGSSPLAFTNEADFSKSKFAGQAG